MAGRAYRVEVVKHRGPLHLLEGHELRLEVGGRSLHGEARKPTWSPGAHRTTRGFSRRKRHGSGPRARVLELPVAGVRAQPPPPPARPTHTHSNARCCARLWELCELRPAADGQAAARESTWLEATMAATMAAAIRPARTAEVAFRVLRTGTCQSTASGSGVRQFTGRERGRARQRRAPGMHPARVAASWR